MTTNAKQPALATPAVMEIDLVGASINSINSSSSHVHQDMAAAVIASRYRLSPCIARTVCFLAGIGGEA